MAWGSRVSALTRRYVAEHGLHLSEVHQPAWRFRRDVDRRLPRVALPCDPWRAVLSTEHFMGDTFEGYGETPDEAVLAAMPSGMRAALARLEVAVDSLHDCLQK